jgi:hypothetical protein
MSASARPTSGVDPAPSGLAAAGSAWLAYWFTPADSRPLALVRILTGLLGLALVGSYAADLEAWFGPGGMIPVSATGRSGPTFSLFAMATSASALQALFGVLVAALGAVALGLASRLACLVAAVLWAALLNRGPVLAGPADDCLAVLLWCLAVGPSGAVWSLDRWIGARRGSPPPAPSPWARVALGLIRVHAVAITAGLLLAQLKGDAWWDGTAAWWLAARSQSRLVDLTGLYRGSEYLMNLVTHAIVGFEVLFAGGLWFDATRRLVARAGIVAWPLIGILAGEPFWGLALAIFCVPDTALLAPPAAAQRVA